MAMIDDGRNEMLRRPQPNTRIVIGGAWGDEGKGKITSKYSEDAYLVIRATGGANAGHTIVYNGTKIALHLIPGGIVYPQTVALIGQGVVLDPEIFFEEVEALKNIGIPYVDKRIHISGRTHIVFPYHKELDVLHEKLKANPIGTTKRGIGPTYEDMDRRTGIRVYELLMPFDELERLIDEATKAHNILFRACGMPEVVVDPHEMAEKFHEYGKRLKPFVERNADQLTWNAYINGKKVVVEGAQAFRLDKFNGDYPDCTSSNCVTAGAILGGHLNHKMIKEVTEVVKAHSSRVGNGPFPTELPAHIENDKVMPYDVPFEGDVIRELAHEYGATTKRPRRVGWFDAVLVRSSKVSIGPDNLCVNHLDTLGQIGNKLGEVKMCVAYLYQGTQIDYYPDDMRLTGEVPEPLYRSFKGGWEIDPSTRDFEDLPEKAKEYIYAIEEETGIFVKYIGVGPGNDDLIVREE